MSANTEQMLAAIRLRLGAGLATMTQAEMDHLVNTRVPMVMNLVEHLASRNQEEMGAWLAEVFTKPELVHMTLIAAILEHSSDMRAAIVSWSYFEQAARITHIIMAKAQGEVS